jgi:hypothetical protein
MSSVRYDLASLIILHIIIKKNSQSASADPAWRAQNAVRNASYGCFVMPEP